MSHPVFTTDGDDIVLVLCLNQDCLWGSTFQYCPDDETPAEWAVSVAGLANEQHAEHACPKPPLGH